MRTVALAISKTLLPGIDSSAVGTMLKDLFKQSKNTVFVTDLAHASLRAMVEKYAMGGKLVPMVVSITKFKKKRDAYVARALAVAGMASECYSFHDMNDWTASAVLIASVFRREHPDYTLATYLVAEDQVVEMTLDDLIRTSGFKEA